MREDRIIAGLIDLSGKKKTLEMEYKQHNRTEENKQDLKKNYIFALLSKRVSDGNMLSRKKERRG